MMNNLLSPLARMGYFSRGVVYLIIGILAVMSSFGQAEKQNTKGAVQLLMEHPVGTVMVWILIVGLIGYSLWRLIQSAFDADDHGTSIRGLIIRVALMVSAFTYLTLAIYSASLVGIFSGGDFGGASGNSSDEGSSIADILSGFVGTAWVSIGLLLIFVGVAGAHWYKAWRGKYANHMEAPHQYMSVIHVLSKTGLFARGMVFLIFAILLLYNVIAGGNSGHQQPGMEEAMSFIHGLPLGNILLAAMGIGLISFSIYSFIESLWRKISVQ